MKTDGDMNGEGADLKGAKLITMGSYAVHMYKTGSFSKINNNYDCKVRQKINYKFK